VRIYSFDPGELTSFANQVNDNISSFSGIDLDGYVVTVAEKRWFGRVKSWLLPSSKEEDLCIVISLVKKGATL